MTMTPIRVMMVDDEPLIRKVVKMEMNSRSMNVESGDIDASVTRRVEMVDTFADGPALLAALGNIEPPDYLLVDMEFQGEPTGGLAITRRVHERYPSVRIIIFSGRFDNPQQNAMPDADREQRLHDIGRVVMDALALGANAFVSGHNDVLVGGRKVSGSAFFVHPSSSIVHCTLMHSVDLDMLQSAITPPAAKLARHSVQSVRQRVANLTEFLPKLETGALKDALRAAFCSGERPLSAAELEAIEELEKSYDDPSFILGKAA